MQEGISILSGHFYTVRTIYRNDVTMQTELSKCGYVHYNVFPGKTHQAFLLSHWRWPVACALTPVKCLLIRIHSSSTDQLRDCIVRRFVGQQSYACVARVNRSVHLHLPFLIAPNKRQKWGLRRQKVPCVPCVYLCIC